MSRTELLEREAEARRQELANTFEELRSRATPGHMLDQLVDYASDSRGGDFFRNLRDQTVANPLALGLVGAGLVWLMMGSRDGRRGHAYDPFDTYDDELQPSRSGLRGALAGTRERASDAMSGVSSGLSAAMSGARHFVSDTAAGVRERVSGAAQGTAHMAAGAAHLASDAAYGAAQVTAGAAHLASDLTTGAAGSVAATARSAREAAVGTASSLGERAGDTTAALGGAAAALYGGVSQTAGRTASGVRAFASGTASTGRDAVDFARDQPLVLAGLGLALGAAFGAAFASTETERALMGEASDQLKERTQAFAQENYEKSKSAAKALYGEAQGLNAESTGDQTGGQEEGDDVGRHHATSLVPLEEELTEIETAIRPERIGLRDTGRS
jgi:hypothetical protein